MLLVWRLGGTPCDCLRRKAAMPDPQPSPAIRLCITGPRKSHDETNGSPQRLAQTKRGHLLSGRSIRRHKAGGVQSRASCRAERLNCSPGRGWKRVVCRASCKSSVVIIV